MLGTDAYVIEYAKSGRSRCRLESCPTRIIEKGHLRTSRVRRSRTIGHPTTHYWHWECTPETVVDAIAATGLDHVLSQQLSAADRARVMAAVPPVSAAAGPSTAGLACAMEGAQPVASVTTAAAQGCSHGGGDTAEPPVQPEQPEQPVPTTGDVMFDEYVVVTDDKDMFPADLPTVSTTVSSTASPPRQAEQQEQPEQEQPETAVAGESLMDPAMPPPASGPMHKRILRSMIPKQRGQAETQPRLPAPAMQATAQKPKASKPLGGRHTPSI
ncbi:hypothetical protein BC831DRAFT_458316 [Entophlyctis helioformis]|nr:hypothetical protein BC831DRAFT_458316 [Entophlyctis helioformis]